MRRLGRLACDVLMETLEASPEISVPESSNQAHRAGKSPHGLTFFPDARCFSLCHNGVYR